MENRSESSGESLKKITRIVDEFRVIESDLAMSYASVFLYIARHEATEGQAPSIKDISNHVGLVQPTVSRICQALGDRRQGSRRAGEKAVAGSRMALKLLEKQPDPVDQRVTRWGLSTKGRGLLNRLTDVVE